MRVEDEDMRGPHWRAILEARWRGRLEEVIELSGAYHAAAADAPVSIEDGRARRLLRQAVAARQRLADTEGALGRLAAGGFGQCEQCGTRIPDVLLAAAPEARYCTRCVTAEIVTDKGAAAAGPGAGAAHRGRTPMSASRGQPRALTTWGRQPSGGQR
jgi:RNA polymerase-binding transcription factor DksA